MSVTRSSVAAGIKYIYIIYHYIYIVLFLFLLLMILQLITVFFCSPFLGTLQYKNFPLGLIKYG